MPTHYMMNCTECDYRAPRYPDATKCPRCGAVLVRENQTPYHLPHIKLPERQPDKKIWKILNPKNPNYIFGFLSSLAGVGIRRQERFGEIRIFIDIAEDKIALVTPDDWAEIQAAVKLFGEE